MSSFTGMSCAQLFKKIGTPNAPRIIDTRLAEDYARDTALIPSSRRILHQTVLNTLQDKPQDTPTAKTVVVCQQGHKISNGTAAVLRAQGVPEEVLSGGFCAWHEQGLPLVSLQALPEKHRQAGLWVTRHRPKIDRIACPWLLRRFIDPDAHILFVPPSEVLAVADTFDAISFGIEQGEITHEGPLCTFEVMLERFELHRGLDPHGARHPGRRYQPDRDNTTSRWAAGALYRVVKTVSQRQHSTGCRDDPVRYVISMGPRRG